MPEIYFQHIGSKHFLSPPSLLLMHNGYRSLINAGENVQRYCFEHKIKLSKIRNILLTTISVETVGGLPGLLLTLSGIGVNKVRVVGPEPIIQYLLMFGYIVRAQKVKGHYISTILSINSQEMFENFECTKSDQEIEVIQLGPSSRSLRLDLDHDVYVECYTSSSFPELRACLHKDPSGSLCTKSRRIEDSSSLCFPGPSALYMFEFPEKKGKFDVSRAKELGIPPGPLYSKLKNGETIMLADSRIVRSSEVCSPPVKIPWSIVLHTVDPSESSPFCSIITQILTSKGFDFRETLPIQGAHPGSIPEPLSIFYIFQLQAFRGSNLGTPPSILEIDSRHIANRRYLSKGVIKVVGLNQGLNTLKEQEINPFITSHLIQKFLNNICPPIFPIPSAQASELAWNQLFLVSPGNVPFKDEYLISALQKKSRFAPISQESEHKIQALKKEFEEIFSQNVAGIPFAIFPCLYVLGTGSAMPSSYRNVSGNLLRLDYNTSIMLDCGEGSMSQLFTICKFNPEVFSRIIASIKIVFISHPHEDHYLGLFKLIQLKKSLLSTLHVGSSSRPAQNGPLYHYGYHQNSNRLEEVCFNDRIKDKDLMDMVIIGPRKVEKILDLFQERIIVDKRKQLSDFEISFITTDHRMHDAPKNRSSPKPPPGGFPLKLENFPVKHTRFSSGLKITFRLDRSHEVDGSPFTIVFSGDTTTPCASLEDASRNCDILIHEATFEDSLYRDAIEKNHSTISGAIRTALNSSAKFLLITHFSQRYFSIPKFEINDKYLSNYFSEKTLCMMDLMIIPLLSVDKLIKGLHCLNQLIREYLP